MAKYMMKATYTVDGTKGLLKDGGSARRAAVRRPSRGWAAGYFTLGEPDAFAILDVPDAVSP